MRGQKKRGKRIAPSLIAFSLVLLVCCAIIPVAKSRTSAVLAYVDGEPIYVEEFQLFMTHDRGEAAAYFYENYGATDGPEFWDSSYGDITPLEYLKELALEEAVATKVMQIYAKQEGITDNIDYGYIKKLWEHENQQRAKKTESGDVVFGPMQFSLPDFYGYQNGNWKTKLYKKYVLEHSTAGDTISGPNKGYIEFQDSLDQRVQDAQLEIRQDQWSRLSV